MNNCHIKDLFFEFAYQLGDMMGIELRAGTDANDVEYKTNAEMRSKMFDIFMDFYDKKLLTAVNDIHRCAWNDGRAELQNSLRELLGLTSDDD